MIRNGSRLSRTVSAWAVIGLIFAICATGVFGQQSEKRNENAAARSPLMRALDEPTSIDFVETPLEDILDYLEYAHHVDIRFDRAALDEVGMTIDVPVSCDLHRIKLKSALELILEEIDLAYVIENEVLRITTAEKAEATLVAKSYPVRDLLFPASAGPKAGVEPDFKPLIEAITGTVAPKSWMARGGAASLDADAHNLALVCAQSGRTHRQIAQLLEDLRAAPAFRMPVGARLARALERPASIKFVDKPLTDVIRHINKSHKIDIQFDQRSLDSAGCAIDEPVSCNIHGVKLKSALSRLLRPLDLDYLVRHEILLIASREKAESTLDTRVYPVHDLTLTADGAAEIEPLIASIIGKISPRSTARGPGTIVAYSPKSALVCLQTRRGHERIERLLDEMREARGPQLDPGRENGKNGDLELQLPTR